MEYYSNKVLRTELKNNVKIGYWPSVNKEYQFIYTDYGDRKSLICYYDNNKNIIQYRCSFINDKKSVNEEWFHEDGNPKEIIPFNNGIIDGTGYYWDGLGNKIPTKWNQGKKYNNFF